ncbi:apolipoprotein N-acyltransferase [Nocardioides caldifontis]|uniref:apolipoprotein N-acyltransferase n=1 Tax=Nocardioides caldifontis TaxID=2588938 RepID=UPI0011DF7904|nr:apolipoprotein N-acyltransferase [Nocardioides caldifontis]
MTRYAPDGNAGADAADARAADATTATSRSRGHGRSLLRRTPATGVLARVVLAVAAGFALYLTFEPHGLWSLGPIGLATLFGVLHGRSARAGFGYGLLFGLGMMLPLLWWAGEFVGPVGSLPLGTLQALLVAPVTAGIAVVSRCRAAPVWAAALWVAGETLRSLVPFGGFPWAKVAFGQVDGVLLPLAAVGGTPLVGFAVALCGFSLIMLMRTVWRSRRPGGARHTVAVAALVAGVLVPLGAGVAAGALVSTSPQDGTVTVAAVQGNVPRAGLEFNAERRAVLDNHVRETLRLAGDVDAGRVPTPDLVLWPENSSDIDPYANADAYAQIERASDAVGVPVLVGAVVGGDGPAPRNTVLQWDPAAGPVAEYAKRRLQPFGETMPMRDFFRLFTDQVDEAGRFTSGTEATVFDIAAGDSGSVRVAITLCYEVIFDSTVRDSILGGANLLTVPSNNATFGYTDMTHQQLAIDRFRAVEHSRSVVVPTTSGVSAIINPDGNVVASSGMFEPATLVARVPLRSELTVADRLGPVPEGLLTLAGVTALAGAVIPWSATRTAMTPAWGGAWVRAWGSRRG